jgi:protein-tyrosine phosphatase
MKRDLLDFAGSDAHDTLQRPPSIGACATMLEKQMGYSYARRILIENPSKIVEENHG